MMDQSDSIGALPHLPENWHFVGSAPAVFIVYQGPDYEAWAKFLTAMAELDEGIHLKASRKGVRS